MLALKDLMREAAKLTPAEQDELSSFLVHLRERSTSPSATPGELLIEKMDDFTFAPGAVDEMMNLIEQHLEQVNPNEWA